MAYRVLLTNMAEGDIASVLAWFSDQRATEVGGRWIIDLKAKLDTLTTHPERCSRAVESDDIGEEIRELSLGRGRYKHRLLFRIDGKIVYLLRVWHSSRDSIAWSDVEDA